MYKSVFENNNIGESIFENYNKRESIFENYNKRESNCENYNKRESIFEDKVREEPSQVLCWLLGKAIDGVTDEVMTAIWKAVGYYITRIYRASPKWNPPLFPIYFKNSCSNI